MRCLNVLFSLSFTLLLLTLTGFATSDTLEAIEDKELEKLIASEQFVLVLFAPSENDEKSLDFEAELSVVREDLVDTMNAWVVKAVASNMTPFYVRDPTKPAVVFFRQKVPVLYEGPANEEEILAALSQFKESPCTRELNDNNFEHLTQAATGATTGDWFVMFVRDEAESDAKTRGPLNAAWETLACKMRGRANVAKVDKMRNGAVTSRRFGITNDPEFILFRLGKMYRYTIKSLDVASLEAFMTSFYKNVEKEDIPLPKSPFDDLVQMCVDFLREEPVLSGVFAGLPILILCLFYYATSVSGNAAKKSKKKKKNAKKDK